MKRGVLALGLIASTVAIVIPASSAETPGFITIQFGRTQYVSINGAGCEVLPNTITLDQAADAMAARGLTGVGNVIVNRAPETGFFCARDGLSLHPGWDWMRQRSAQGWRFISASVSYANITQLAYDGQVHESCGSLPAFTAHGIEGAQGMFAYPNDKSTVAIQTDPVSTCFDYGRKYGSGLNVQTQMAAPWFSSVLTVNGGKCNDPALPCYTISAPLRYSSPDVLVAGMSVTPGSWYSVQFYRFVTGAYSSTHSSWDCTSPDWRAHWVSRNELYCYEDFLRVMDAAQAAVAAGALVTDPHSVAQAWGRAPSPTPPPPPTFRPDGLLALSGGSFVGDDVFGTDGNGQSIVQVPVARGGAATFSWRVENQGTATDLIRFKAQARSQGFAIRITAGGIDVTGSVVAGTFGRTIAPGDSISLVVRISVLPAAATGMQKRELLTATSQDGVSVDAVLAGIRVV